MSRPVEGIAHDKCMIQALEVSNNHYHEIGSWLAHYGEKIYYFPFSDTFSFLEEAIKEKIGYLYFNRLISILIDVRHLSQLGS